MTTRRLRQVHPPGKDGSLTGQAVAPGNPPDGVHIDVTASGPDRWEGTVRLVDGQTVRFLACRDGLQVHIWLAGESYVFGPATPTTRGRGSGQAASDDIVAPVPGVVIEVYVSVDDLVEAGQDLVIIESMKTEQIVKSPRDGTVQRVSVQPGDRIDRGMRLVVLHPLSEG